MTSFSSMPGGSVVVKKDGGNAFPSVVQTYAGISVPEFHSGMSLRDYFAAKAINAMIELDCRNIPKLDAALIASNSYAIADAMLKAREAK